MKVKFEFEKIDMFILKIIIENGRFSEVWLNDKSNKILSDFFNSSLVSYDELKKNALKSIGSLWENKIITQCHDELFYKYYIITEQQIRNLLIKILENYANPIK